MKHHITHIRMLSNSIGTSQLILIDIVQITDVIIVPKLARISLVNTHLFTYLRATNNEQK